MKIIAIPTRDRSGRHGKIADVLSRAETITIVTIDDGKPAVVETLVNPFCVNHQGSGPLFAQYLHELGVTTVITRNLGPGAKAQLMSRNIQVVINEDMIKVHDAFDAYKEL